MPSGLKMWLPTAAPPSPDDEHVVSYVPPIKYTLPDVIEMLNWVAVRPARTRIVQFPLSETKTLPNESTATSAGASNLTVEAVARSPLLPHVVVQLLPPPTAGDIDIVERTTF